MNFINFIADLKLGGCLVPWEERIDCNTYIAAHFDFVDEVPSIFYVIV